MIDSSSKKHFNSFRESLSNFQKIETKIRNIYRLFFDEKFLTNLIIVNEFCNINDFDHFINENFNNFLIFENLLFDIEKTKNSKRSNLNRKHKKKISKHTIKKNYNEIIIFDSTRNKKKINISIMCH